MRSARRCYIVSFGYWNWSLLWDNIRASRFSSFFIYEGGAWWDPIFTHVPLICIELNVMKAGGHRLSILWIPGFVTNQRTGLSAIWQLRRSSVLFDFAACSKISSISVCFVPSFHILLLHAYDRWIFFQWSANYLMTILRRRTLWRQTWRLRVKRSFSSCEDSEV